MKVLGIDTSTIVASVALMDDTKLIGEITLNNKKTHSQKLMVIIDQLLKNSETKLEDLDAIAVAVGPGSFTGLRIGITTAKGLAHPFNLKVYEISSLEALANNIKTDNLICPMMDSRRNTVFTRLESKELLVDDNQLHIDELLEKVSSYNEKTIFLGDGAILHKELISEKLGELSEIAPNHLLMPLASSVCELAIRKYSDLGVSYDSVKANYLRKTQAEREYDERQEKKK